MTKSTCMEAAREALRRDLKESLRLLRVARQNDDKEGIEAHENRLNATLEQLSTLGGE